MTAPAASEGAGLRRGAPAQPLARRRARHSGAPARRLSVLGRRLSGRHPARCADLRHPGAQPRFSLGQGRRAELRAGRLLRARRLCGGDPRADDRQRERLPRQHARRHGARRDRRRRGRLFPALWRRPRAVSHHRHAGAFDRRAAHRHRLGERHRRRCGPARRAAARHRARPFRRDASSTRSPSMRWSWSS